MIYDYQSSRDYLKAEFDSRVRKNPQYSLRSFARFLKMHPAELSQIFSGKRHLSLTSAKKVSDSLGLSQDECRHLFQTLHLEKGRVLGLNLEFVDDAGEPTLPEESFGQVSQWFHFAILNLTETKNFEWSARYISKRLGLTLSQASLAMQDLLRLGLVQPKKGAGKKIVVASPKIPSYAIRKYHHQVLEKAKQALDEVAIEKREFQSLGFVISQDQIPQLKSEIDEFTNRLLKKYHRTQANDVYQLQICLFPITQENP
jgi:uncharacterized protein (TIGR02147 family)